MGELVPNPLVREELVELEPLPGVRLIRLPEARDERGVVTKLWQDFGPGLLPGPVLGEVYLSSVNPGAIKGWHLHRRMTLRYICVQGAALVGLCDMRMPEHKTVPFVILSDGTAPWQAHRYALIIPPGVANGFRAAHQTLGGATILNLANIRHDPDEIKRIPLSAIDFEWGPHEVSG
jgi:dTDP-4-dehydrorhamnose 3,5-epimerase